MDPATFEGIYRTYFADVFRYALWLCGNRELAEEITSTTFFRAWTCAPLRESTAKSYLLTIARNLYVDSRRVGQRSVKLEEAGSLRCQDSDPEAKAQARQLWEALGGLEGKYREPLELWAGGGLSYEEIAAELGIPLAAVKTRIHRARLLLAGRFEEGGK